LRITPSSEGTGTRVENYIDGEYSNISCAANLIQLRIFNKNNKADYYHFRKDVSYTQDEYPKINVNSKD